MCEVQGGPISCSMPMRMSSGSSLLLPSGPLRSVYRRQSCSQCSMPESMSDALSCEGIQHILQHVLGSSCDFGIVSPCELFPSLHFTTSNNSHYNVESFAFNQADEGCMQLRAELSHVRESLLVIIGCPFFFCIAACAGTYGTSLHRP